MQRAIKPFGFLFTLMFSSVGFAAEPELRPIEKEAIEGCSKLKKSAFGTEQDNKKKERLRTLFCHRPLITQGDRQMRVNKAVKPHLGRGFSKETYRFDETYTHSQLDLLLIALVYSERTVYFNEPGRRTLDETVMLDDRRVPWAISYAARNQLDEAALAEEMKAAGFGGPSYAAEVKRWLGLLDEQLSKLDDASKAAAGRSPTLAATFKDAVSVVAFYRKQAQEFPKDLAAQNKLLAQLRAGKKLDAKACDTPIVEGVS